MNVLMLDLCAQQQCLERGELSAVQLVTQQLAAIEVSQPVLNSYLSVDAQGALAAAAESDARRARGEARALEGLTLAVKDNIDVAGMVTTAGMETRRQRAPAKRDNPAVAALRAAGMIVLGKLNMQEAALGADNDNPYYGACHNPHRPGFTPGGSSGGSGAAVAAGLCSAALGTDSMGSIRIPSSYCGVVGIKPSWGAVSTRGTVLVNRRLDHVGPLARSARDLQRLLPVMIAHDPACAQSRQIVPETALDGPLRIGTVDFSSTVEIDSDVQTAFEQGLAALMAMGHQRVELPPPIFSSGQARRAGLLLCEVEMLIEHADDWQQAREKFSPLLQKLLAFAEGKSALDATRASFVMDQAQLQLQHWLTQCDVLVMPTTPQRAFAFGGEIPANQADLTAYANMAGAPAISIPLPVAQGELPVGLQCVGPVGSECTLTSLAEAFLLRMGWIYRAPEACHEWWPG